MSVLMYLLKVILCSGILFGYYYLFLRNKRFHHYNRFYLLAALGLSMVLPLVRIQVLEEDGMLQQVAYRSVKVVTLQAQPATADAAAVAAPSTPFTLTHLLWVVYGVGVLYLLVELARSLRYIQKLSLKYPYEMIEQLKLFQTNEPGTPFSFFRSIYWNEDLNFNSVQGQQIFRHELFHVQQRHSADTIAAELITMLGWFNPFFYLIKRELKAIHEFLADQYAASGSNRYQYAELLVQQVMESRSPAITHPFFQNQLKRRIAMIMQHNQSKYGYWSRVMVLPISVFLFFSVSLYAQERKAGQQAATQSGTKGQEANHASLERAYKLTPGQGQPATVVQDTVSVTGVFSRDVERAQSLNTQQFAGTTPPRWVISAITDTVVPNRKAAEEVRFNNFDVVYDKKVFYADSTRAVNFTTVKDKNYLYADTVNFKFVAVNDRKMNYTDSTRAIHFSADKNFLYKEDGKVNYRADTVYRFEPVQQDTIVPKLQRFFNKNYRYPVEFLNNHGEGSIYYSFTLDEQGNLKDLEVYNGVPKAPRIYEIVIVGYVAKEPAKTLSTEEKYQFMKSEVDRVAAKDAPLSGKFKRTKYFFKATWKVQKEGAASKPITSTSHSHEKTYVKVDEIPVYTGGANAWKQYLDNNLQYPAQAKAKKVEGTVIVQFVVKQDGSVQDVQAISGPDELKAEAYRLVVNSAANWQPGKQGGRAVHAYRTQPIIFKL